MRPPIRLCITLVTVLAICALSSSSYHALVRSRMAQQASARLEPLAGEGKVKELLCGESLARQHGATAWVGAGAGQAVSHDSASALIDTSGASVTDATATPAPSFSEGVETVEATADPGEPFILGLPDDGAAAAVSSSLGRTAQTFDVRVGPSSNTFGFVPAALTIHVGDTVRWTWESSNHTVTSGANCTVDNQYCSPNNTNCSSAPPSSTGFIYTHTFNTAGTFSYFCSFHCGFGMRGTITVEEAGNTFTVSGKVATGNGTLVSGLTMKLTGSKTATTTTNSSGNYSFANLAPGGNYTVTPTATNYTFTPVSRSYTNLSANQANQNFTAKPKLYSISGQVKLGANGLSSVTMTLASQTAGFTPRTQLTNSSGGYTFVNVPGGRSYKLTPSKTNYTFKNSSNPAQSFRSYTNLSANKANQNFTATLKTYTISGRVTRAGTTTGIGAVKMTLTSPTPAGFTPRTSQTNSNGGYSFTNVPAARNYTLKPTKSGFTFNPASRSYNNLSANQAGAATSFAGTSTAPAPSAAHFSDAHYRAAEGDGSIEVTVIRSGDVSFYATVDYATEDGTASDRSDYSTILGRLRFYAGETSKTFTIFLTDDAYVEGEETINLTLGNATGGLDTESSGMAVLTITDNDDTASATNPIDDPAFFVRQLYVDFGGEPDPKIISMHVQDFHQCAALNPGCPDRASFFADFPLTACIQPDSDFIHRFYKTALGRVPLYREFVRDMHLTKIRFCDGVMPSRERFFDEWTNHSEFKEKYGALSDKDYVDQLLQADGTEALAARDAMVSALESGSRTRAQVLRDVVERAQFSQQDQAAATISMLYFRYLRRDPDPEGFNMLLEMMTQNPQNYRQVVESFINSTEYRSRFGPQ